MSDALEAFKKATGRDFETDAEIHAALVMLRQGLDEAEQPLATRIELVAGDGCVPAQQRPLKRRGAPATPRNLSVAVEILVGLLGSSDAALAILLSGLHKHRGFFCSDLPKHGQPTFDVREVRRTIAQRLDAIVADCRKRKAAKHRAVKDMQEAPAGLDRPTLVGAAKTLAKVRSEAKPKRIDFEACADTAMLGSLRSSRLRAERK